MPAAIPAVIGAVGAIGGALISKRSNADAAAAQAEANKGDPRKNAMLFGENGGTGLLQQYQTLGGQPESAGLLKYGQNSDSYLGSNGTADMQNMRDTAGRMANSNLAPSTVNNAAWAVGNKVNAPSQNAMDLSGSYDKFINGDAGANPYLTKALQGGIDQSTNQFEQMQGMATDNLMKNIMPSIRSNSVLSGQFGGSRQGIAEGNAIGDFAKAQQQAMTQFGQNNTNATLGAQASSFNQGQDRALAATQGLGAQQYGVASQDANTKNQAEFMNVNQVLDIAKTNAAYNQQTMGLNSANQIAGLGAQQGLLGQTVGAATNQDNYGLNKATMTNNLLSPYLSSNPVQPVAPQSSVAGSALGGAAAGLGLFNQFNQATQPPRNDGMGTGNNYNYQPSQLPLNTGAMQNLGFLNNIGGK